MKKLIIITATILSFSTFAGYVEGKGQITVSSGFYPTAEVTEGVNLKISGQAARVLFNEIAYTDKQGPGVISAQEIRQTETIQCIKFNKREIECRILLNMEGHSTPIPRLILNF